MIKTIRVDEQTWRDLNQLKLDHGFKTIDLTIKNLIEGTNKSD